MLLSSAAGSFVHTRDQVMALKDKKDKKKKFHKFENVKHKFVPNGAKLRKKICVCKSKVLSEKTKCPQLLIAIPPNHPTES